MRKAFYYAVRHAGRTAVREYNRRSLSEERTIERKEKSKYIETRLQETVKLNNEISEQLHEYIDKIDSLYKLEANFNIFDMLKQKNDINLINEWEKEYFLGKKEAIERYIDSILTVLSSIINESEVQLTNNYDFKYELNDKHILLNLYMVNIEQLFNCIGYKYVKSKDEIKSVPASKEVHNELIFFLISRLTIIFLNTLLKSDSANSIDSAVINVKYMNNYYSSISITKNEYNKYNLKDDNDFNIICENHMRICKSLSSEIKPFEE